MPVGAPETAVLKAGARGWMHGNGWHGGDGHSDWQRAGEGHKGAREGGSEQKSLGSPGLQGFPVSLPALGLRVAFVPCLAPLTAQHMGSGAGVWLGFPRYQILSLISLKLWSAGHGGSHL